MTAISNVYSVNFTLVPPIRHIGMADVRVLLSLNGGEAQCFPDTPATHTDLITAVRSFAGYGPGVDLTVQVRVLAFPILAGFVCSWPVTSVVYEQWLDEDGDTITVSSDQVRSAPFLAFVHPHGRCSVRRKSNFSLDAALSQEWSEALSNAKGAGLLAINGAHLALLRLGASYQLRLVCAA